MTPSVVDVYVNVNCPWRPRQRRRRPRCADRTSRGAAVESGRIPSVYWPASLPPPPPMLASFLRIARLRSRSPFPASSPTRRPRCPPARPRPPASKASPSTGCANGLRVLLMPDATQADDDGERHLPRRLAARELRRDRHGAPARAPGVQGHAVDPRRLRRSSAGAACASTARPRSTARTTSRRSPRTTRTSTGRSRMEAERMTQSTFSKADLDTEMTVVRNEFEMGENNPRLRAVEAAAGAGVRLAQLRQRRRSARARTSRTSTSIGCARSTGRTTSPTTRC